MESAFAYPQWNKYTNGNYGVRYGKSSVPLHCDIFLLQFYVLKISIGRAWLCLFLPFFIRKKCNFYSKQKITLNKFIWKKNATWNNPGKDSNKRPVYII